MSSIPVRNREQRQQHRRIAAGDVTPWHTFGSRSSRGHRQLRLITWVRIVNAIVVMRLKRIAGLAVLPFLVSLGCDSGEARQEKVNPDAAVLQDFSRRIDAYLKLRSQADDGAPPLKETSDPAKIKEAQAELAKRIRQARDTARPGDIFTPEVRKLFRRLLYPEVKGPEGAEIKEAIKEDAPQAGAIPFKINASYPENQPLPTVPPDLLGTLPKLPEHLEYRIIGRHLILRDVDANLIVDYMLNAIR